MKKLILLIAVAGVSACGESEESAGSKDLFSLWTHSSSAVTLDLRGAGFGGSEIELQYSPNSGCVCTLEVTGSQTSGTALLYSCDNYGPVNYCSAGATAYTYTNQGGVLTLCDGTCEAYR